MQNEVPQQDMGAVSEPKFTPGPWHVADGGVIWVEAPEPVSHMECCGCPLPSGECCGNGVQAWHEELVQEQIAQCNPQDAHLIAAAPALYEAVRDAAAVFQHYARLHRNKGTPEGRRKAEVNDENAAKLIAVLDKAQGPKS